MYRLIGWYRSMCGRKGGARMPVQERRWGNLSTYHYNGLYALTINVLLQSVRGATYTDHLYRPLSHVVWQGAPGTSSLNPVPGLGSPGYGPSSGKSPTSPLTTKTLIERWAAALALTGACRNLQIESLFQIAARPGVAPRHPVPACRFYQRGFAGFPAHPAWR